LIEVVTEEGSKNMSHEITDKDSMLSVNETPWHKLGVVLENAPSAADAIKIAGLDWTVGLKDLYTIEGQKVPNKATYNVANNNLLGVVGPNYVPLQNADAFNWFNPFIQEGLATIECAGSLKGQKIVWILCKISGEPIQVQEGDTVSKYILLSNSHDSTHAVKVGYTPIRVVCNNTLSMAHSKGTSTLLSIRHTKSLNLTLTKVREMMDVINREFTATEEQYRQLAQTNLDPVEISQYIKVTLDLVDKDNNLSTRASNILTEVTNLVFTGKGNCGRTAWDAYNGITEYLTFNKSTRLRDTDNISESGKSVRRDSSLLYSNNLGTNKLINVRALNNALALSR
jgi:phage/plasmid-like protein (TIGR03299 family)